jgi:hypothetical protein
MKKKKERKEPMKTHPPSIFLNKNCFAPVAELMVTLAAQNCHKKYIVMGCRTNSKLDAKNWIKNLVLGSRNMGKSNCIKLPQNVLMRYKINGQIGNIKLDKRLHYGLSS